MNHLISIGLKQNWELILER